MANTGQPSTPSRGQRIFRCVTAGIVVLFFLVLFVYSAFQDATMREIRRIRDAKMLQTSSMLPLMTFPTAAGRADLSAKPPGISVSPCLGNGVGSDPALHCTK